MLILPCLPSSTQHSTRTEQCPSLSSSLPLIPFGWVVAKLLWRVPELPSRAADVILVFLIVWFDVEMKQMKDRGASGETRGICVHCSGRETRRTIATTVRKAA